MTTPDPLLGDHRPDRTEPRGDAPPEHDGPPPGWRLLTAREAREQARTRLADWRRTHGH